MPTKGTYGEQQAWVDSISSVTLTAPLGYSPGMRRSEAGRDYMYVFNAGESSGMVGYGFTISGTTGYSVTLSSVTGVSPLAGVVSEATAVTDSYFWLCTKGSVPIQSENGTDSLTTGANIMLGTSGAFIMCTVGSDGAAGACGFLTVGAATDASGTGFINSQIF